MEVNRKVEQRVVEHPLGIVGTHKAGFSAEKAGSVEVASSVNGQIMPPVMGAAAFLMVEYVGISYQDVVKHAFLPAVISYIALFYLVDLEAAKNLLPSTVQIYFYKV